MQEERKEELTDAQILELGQSLFQKKELKKELEALNVSAAWISFLRGLRVLNIIAGVLYVIILWLFITAPSGPEAIGFIVLLGPLLIALLVLWINIIASAVFILKYKPKGRLLYLAIGVLLISVGVVYCTFNASSFI